jgi:hypothetical protein
MQDKFPIPWTKQYNNIYISIKISPDSQLGQSIYNRTKIAINDPNFTYNKINYPHCTLLSINIPKSGNVDYHGIRYDTMLEFKNILKDKIFLSEAGEYKDTFGKFIVREYTDSKKIYKVFFDRLCIDLLGDDYIQTGPFDAVNKSNLPINKQNAKFYHFYKKSNPKIKNLPDSDLTISDFYMPDQWKPHISLFDKEKLPRSITSLDFIKNFKGAAEDKINGKIIEGLQLTYLNLWPCNQLKKIIDPHAKKEYSAGSIESIHFSANNTNHFDEKIEITLKEKIKNLSIISYLKNNKKKDNDDNKCNDYNELIKEIKTEL